MAQHYRQLIAWQKAVAMVTEIYRITKDFPREEMYGITSQLRRAAVSIPSNIAEGAGRRTKGEFIQFLGHAYGSLCEVETQATIAANLNSANQSVVTIFLEQTAEVGRIINGLLSSLDSDHWPLTTEDP